MVSDSWSTNGKKFPAPKRFDAVFYRTKICIDKFIKYGKRPNEAVFKSVQTSVIK